MKIPKPIKSGPKPRKPMKRIGRIGKVNLSANKILARRWERMGINHCELNLPGCLKTWSLQNVHRHKRIWSGGNVDLLTRIDQVILGCQSCHAQLEKSKYLTEAMFRLRRGKELKDPD